MLSRNKMLVTNMSIKETKDHVKYAAVGLLSLDDGQKFDVSIRDESVYSRLEPMNMYEMVLQLSNSQYGMRLAVNEVTGSEGSIIGA